MVSIHVNAKRHAGEVRLSDGQQSVLVALAATPEAAIDEAIHALKQNIEALARQRHLHTRGRHRSLTQTERHQLMADHGCDTWEEYHCDR